MTERVKIIDLFAGPGGLGEGFSAYENGTGDQPFKISLSIEKESSAQSTLKLRAFYRQFCKGDAPPEYYSFLNGKLGRRPEDRLYNSKRLGQQARAAADEALQLELGKDNTEIEKKIRNALGDTPGNWVLIGGPPCQAYSLAGRVRRSSISTYRPEQDGRNFLYKEYLNIIARFKPAVFVMENVKGLLSAKINGEPMFARIRHDLQSPAKALDEKAHGNEYEIFPLVKPPKDPDDPSAFIIRAEDHGIPQARHRVILLGVRADLLARSKPQFLELDPDYVPVSDVLMDLPRLRSGVTRMPDNASNWKCAVRDASSSAIPSIQKSGLDSVAKAMNNALSAMETEELNRGSNWNTFISSEAPLRFPLREWYQDPSGWNGICNHESRSHMKQDLARYLFCAAYGMAEGLSPRAHEFPRALAPDHRNWESGKFIDRFKVQLAKHPARTVTSHLGKDGHYFIHQDPSQCRSFTVREAARAQTFPDNYFFVGNRTEQFTQVGNAVPPLLATKIADIVYSLLFVQ